MQLDHRISRCQEPAKTLLPPRFGKPTERKIPTTSGQGRKCLGHWLALAVRSDALPPCDGPGPGAFRQAALEASTLCDWQLTL